MPAKMPIYLKSTNSRKGKKCRLRDILSPDMISPPLGDFRHTVHIGKGGDRDTFGDMSFLQGKFELLPGKQEKRSQQCGLHSEFLRANSASDASLVETPSPVLKNAISLPTIGGSQALTLPIISTAAFPSGPEPLDGMDILTPSFLETKEELEILDADMLLLSLDVFNSSPSKEATKKPSFLSAAPHKPLEPREKNKPIETDLGHSGDMPPAAYTNGNMPTAAYTNGNVPTAAYTNGNVPPAAYTNGNMPTAAYTNGNMPTAAYTNGNVPTAAYTNGNVPPAAYTNGNMPTAAYKNCNVPTAAYTNGNVPTAAYKNCNVPTAAHTNGNVPTAAYKNGNVPTAAYTNGNMAPAAHTNGNMAPAAHTNGNMAPAAHGNRNACHATKLPGHYTDWLDMVGMEEDSCSTFEKRLSNGKSSSQDSFSKITGSLLSLELDLGPSILDDILNIMDKP